MGKKIVKIFIFMSLFQSVPELYSQIYTESSVSWYDKQTLPIFFQISAGETTTTVTVNTYGNPNTPTFYLTFNNGTTDIIKNGTYIFTDEDGVTGKAIQLTESSPGIWELSITNNAGVVSQDEYWGLTLTGLGGGTNQTSADITGGGLFPIGNMWYWKNNLLETSPIDDNDEEINIVFDVNGNNYTNIHKATIYILSSELIESVDLKGKTYGNGSLSTEQEVNITGANSASSWIDSSVGGTAGTAYKFSKPGSDLLYQLEIEALDPGSFPNDYDFDNNEKWQLILHYAAGTAEVKTVVSIKLENNNNIIIPPAADQSLDPATLVRQPLAVITKPVNQPSTLILPVMRERTYIFQGSSNSASVFTWYKDGVKLASLTQDSISDINRAVYSLKSKETVVLSGTPYINFTHFAFDSLTIQSRGKEYAGFAYPRGVPYDDGKEPYIDGIVSGPDGQVELSGSDAGEIYGENGWSGAYRITHSDGAIPEDVAFQAIRSRDGSKLYMSFEVKNDTAIDPADVVVIGIRPDAGNSSSENDRLLQIFPESESIKYFRNSTDWQEYSPAETSDFIVAVQNDTAGHSSWSMEIQIPISASDTEWLEIQDDFLFFYDVLRTFDTGNEFIVSQFTWPRFAPKVRGNIDTFSFSPVWWGIARKADPLYSNGVSIGRWDIGVISAIGDMVNIPTNIMTTSTTGVNTFVARVHNNTTQEISDGSGGVTENAREVSGVNVTFRIANWGVPPADTEYWEIIPANYGGYNNPVQQITSGPGIGTNTINPDSIGQYEAQWQLTSDQRDRYVNDHGPVNELHQCILVELDSTGGVIFINKSVVRNMNFDGASKFEQEARIDGRGYGPAPFGWEKQKFLLFINTQALDKLPGISGQFTEMQPSQLPDESYLTWSAHAMRYTGEIVVINDIIHKIVDPLGSFGHVMIHKGNVREWNYSLSGTTEIKENLLLVEVPVEGVTKVNTVIEAIGPLGLSFSLHAGTVTPVPPSNFANDYSTGFCVFGDLGYKINTRLSAMSLFGYNYFPAKSSGIDATSIINIALNLKYFIPVPNKPVFTLGIGAGPEIFIQDFNTINFGYDLDISLDYKLNKLLTLEAGAVYHSNFDQEDWFIQTHGGILFNF